MAAPGKFENKNERFPKFILFPMQVLYLKKKNQTVLIVSLFSVVFKFIFWWSGNSLHCSKSDQSQNSKINLQIRGIVRNSEE